MHDTITLTAAGDIVIRHRLFGEGAVHSPGYEQTLDYLRKGDLIWGSCEVQFSYRGFRTDSTIAYLVPPEVGRDLGRAGFQLMTVATNHTWDYGPDAFLDTLAHLREGGVTPVGGGRTPEEAWAPHIQEIKGIRLGVLAVSCLVPPYYAALPDRPGIAAIRVRQAAILEPLSMMIEPGAPLRVDSVAEEEDVSKLTEAVRALRGEVDVVVVSIHWGYGRGTPLAAYQRPLARSVIAAGADLILGNHGHSPTAIEFMDGKPVIYSLGNHIAQQDRENATPRQLEIFADIDPWSVVASISLGRQGVEAMELMPTECDARGLPYLSQSGAASQATLRRIVDLSAAAGTSIELSGHTAIVRPQ